MSGDWTAGTKIPAPPEEGSAVGEVILFEVAVEDDKPVLRTGSPTGLATQWDGEPVWVFCD